MVNVIAPIFTSEDDLCLQTIYHPIRLCAEHMQPVVLDAYVDCDKHALRDEASSWPHRVADMGPFDVLDVSATRDDAGRDLTLVVVNRDPDREARTTIQLTDAAFEGTVTAYEVTGEEPGATNDFGRERVGVGERSLEAKGDSLEYVFPACSVTVLRVGLA
jgi:alpha-N-arabinofuranosidase